ncbi:uncharacterized protein LOC126989661 [Eriocheir sinensis]|uniref:uncharacterized protein LOC126989661 n=1 Tax=Eriocheir sinensis TaxID=95602 RepID=UPI0021CA0AAB|nr:uncharacterized protein LOC126989661 [Eriocheir sinensis]
MEAEILYLFNASYASRTVPAAWKSAAIVPIPKAGDATQYRPISVISCLGKTMERVLFYCLERGNGQGRVLSYADDIAIVSSEPNHVARARAMLRRLLASCTEFGLVPNPAKSKAMAFGFVLPRDPLYIDAVLVPWVPQFTYLGMLLDSHLSFKSCIASV